MENIRWGLLGSGKTTARFMKGLALTEGICVAVATHSKQEEWKKNYPSIRVYEDYQTLIEDDEVDAIYISLRHADHYHWAKEALLNHKAVLCEKPATLTAHEIKDLALCAKEQQTFFLEALKTRFMPVRETLKQWVETSGPIHTISNGFGYSVDYNPNSYLFDLNQGGILYDVGSYTLGAILDVVHSPLKTLRVKSELLHGIDVYTVVEFQFENGIIAHSQMALDRPLETIMTIECEKATIVVENFHRPTRIHRDTSHGRETIEIMADDFVGEIEAVHQGIHHHHIESKAYTHRDSIQVIEWMEKIHQEIHS